LEHKRAGIRRQDDLRRRAIQTVSGFPWPDGHFVLPSRRLLAPGENKVLFDRDAVERESGRADAADRFDDVPLPDRASDDDQRMGVTKAHEEETMGP